MRRARSKGIPPQSLRRTSNLSYKIVGQAAVSTDSVHYYPGPCSNYVTMVDETHPGFFKAIKNGDLILGPLSLRKLTRTVPDGFSASYLSKPAEIEYWSRTGTANWTAAMLAISSPVYDPPAFLGLKSDDQLYIDALAAVDPTDFHMMEDVLQMTQFFESLTKPFREMLGVVRRVRSGGKFLVLGHKDARQILNTATNAWLTYRFELIPMYNTIIGLIKGQSRPWKKLKKGVRLRASASSRAYETIIGSYWNPSQHEQFSVKHLERREKRAIVFYQLNMERAGIAQTYGTRLKDLPVGMWNVVRLSFMLDRVINITGYISAVVNACDANIRYEGSCLVDRSWKDLEIRLLKHYYDTTYVVSTQPVREITETVNRSIGPNSVAALIDPRKLDFRLKDLANSATKVADLVSLLYQSMSK